MPQIDDQREFSAHLMYECCTLIFIQGMVYGLLKIRVTDEGTGDFLPLGVALVLGVPYLHTLYFYWRLSQRYAPERKVAGALFIMAAMAGFLFVAGALNELMLADGIAVSGNGT